MKLIGLSLALACTVTGQTTIDFNNQVRNGTKPVKTGTVLPVTCRVGDLFLKQDAVPGANLYGCVSTDTWVLQAGGGGGGSLSIASDGVSIGAAPVLNFTNGAGILKTLSSTGSRIDISTLIDTAVVQTHANVQAGRDLFCDSPNTSGPAYTCTIVPVLPMYTLGMVLEWRPGVTTGGGAITLAVDLLSPISVKLADGVSDPTSADVVAGMLTPIWFDGSAFRLFASVGQAAVGSSRPSCTTAVRGRIWLTPGVTGTKDGVAVCAKSDTDMFDWRVIY